MFAIEKSSYVDPNGYVFRTEQGLFRAIRPTSESFYRDFLGKGAVDRLVAAGLLIDTRIAASAPRGSRRRSSCSIARSHVSPIASNGRRRCCAMRDW